MPPKSTKQFKRIGREPAPVTLPLHDNMRRVIVDAFKMEWNTSYTWDDRNRTDTIRDWRTFDPEW